MRKKFGLDIDGTVTCPTSMIPFINKAFHMNILYQDVNQYELTPFVNVSEEVFSKWFIENEPIIYRDSPPAAGVLNVLNKWKNKHELYYISARGPHLHDVTEKWFLHHGVSFDHIELVGSHDKIETVKKHQLEIFFEDKHDNAVMIHEACHIPVILFNTPYNQEPIPNGVIRVNDWFEAYDWVESWLREAQTPLRKKQLV
ncbi:5' nucleotidase, NT5C type [Neobacillus jeddahensis]|uniref:5' nucleotidase, NT5C type n=1 Tax=Neobacillus jeddahensis TaxID=1461580 RepID=UPI00058D1B13|nr:nucleotidase [Neobacillus jeddahensis]